MEEVKHDVKLSIVPPVADGSEDGAAGDPAASFRVESFAHYAGLVAPFAIYPDQVAFASGGVLGPVVPNMFYSGFGLNDEAVEALEKVAELSHSLRTMLPAVVTQENPESPKTVDTKKFSDAFLPKITEIKKEIGDVFWYLADLATKTGCDLGADVVIPSEEDEKEFAFMLSGLGAGLARYHQLVLDNPAGAVIFGHWQQCSDNVAAASNVLVSVLIRCGHLQGRLKKAIRQDGGAINEDFMKVIHANLHEIAQLLVDTCDRLGISTESVLRLNYEKLSGRAVAGKLNGDGDNR